MKLRVNRNPGLWLSALMFIASILFQSFHKDLGFWLAGGFGLAVSVPLVFMKAKRDKKAAELWLSAAMFSASVLFQGFHRDLGFLWAAIIGFMALVILLFSLGDMQETIPGG